MYKDKFSLVLGTVGRTVELQRFLYHLKRQTYTNFELIIVDQNQDNRLISILEPYQDSFRIIHIKTSQRGLSRARNKGLQYISGYIVGFPDDDCWYEETLLEQVHNFLIENPQ